MELHKLIQEIKEEFKNTLVNLGYFSDDIEIIIEIPKGKDNGDYSTNIAMKLARVARKAPIKIAEEILGEFKKDGLFISKIVIANPGFINIYLDKSFLTNIISDINAKKSEYGKLNLGEGEHYNIEFVSVNPTGSLHIGHARGASAGDSISRIMKKAGYNVTKEYYVNDGGNQIHNLALSIDTRYKQLFGKENEMPKDGYHGKEIIEIAKILKDEYNDRFLNEDGYEFFKYYGVNSLLDVLKKDLADFGVVFDVWFSEKSLYDNNVVKNTIKYLKENNFTYEKDGAVWLKTSDYNDEKDRVIIKSDGTYTYLMPDIGYHKNKLERGYTKLIDILGGDHHGYINRLKAAIEMVSGKSNLLEIEILQMVKVIQDGEEVKMSKRSGKAITLRDIIDEVGVDPIRYFFAMRSLNTHMDLDLDLALKQTNENPVYYTQYAHARINSIFTTAKQKGFDVTDLPNTFTTLTGDKTFNLIQILGNYPDAIKQSALQRAPHKITNYVNNLASAFHSFYNDEQVIGSDQLKTMERLALLNATKIVLKDALNLVGVSAPNKM
ncbi:MAG: arginine--tRNA ligase [Candidatus Izimaplasma sp.]|nr:arginine--tRNA ligase [Candidatus Izimaplasma bacterium]